MLRNPSKRNIAKETFMNDMTRRALWAMAGAVLWMAPAPAEAQWNPNDARTATDIKNAFRPVVKDAGKSTVKVRYAASNGAMTQAALGTVITDDGYILTKASEVIGW